MNLKKTLSLFAMTALFAVSSFAVTQTALAPTLTTTGYTAIGTGAAAVYPNTLKVTIVPDAHAGACYYTSGASTGLALATTASTACAVTAPYTTVTITGTFNMATQEISVLNTPATGATAYKNGATTGKYLVQPQLATPKPSPLSSTGPISVTFTEALVTGETAYPAIKYVASNGADPAAGGTVTSIAYSATNHDYPSTIFSQPTTFRAYLTGYAPSAPITGGYNVPSTAEVVVGIGSSAQFFEYSLAMGGILGDGNGAACGEAAYGGHHFSAKNGAQAIDNRSGLTPADTGNLVIVWDNSNDSTVTGLVNGSGAKLYPSPAAPKKVCVYLSLDSTLGVKAFMNSNLSTPSDFLNITATTGVGNQITPFWVVNANNSATADEAKIPSDVLAIAQGHPFNLAVTDIRPEDAKYATTRALAKLTATRTGLGYGSGTNPIGNAIKEEGTPWTTSPTTFNVVDFALTGKDPINKLVQGTYTTVPVGAAPVVVLVNTTVPADGIKYHFSDPALTNISRFTLAGYLNGSITGTNAVNPSATSTLATAPASVWLREPLSGTYNTMEFNVPHLAEINSSQEIGVDPTIVTADANGNTGNPLNITVGAVNCTTCTNGSYFTTGASAGKMIGVPGATRRRAIGTGDAVKAVAYPGYDSIGYSFWGFGNIKSGNNCAAPGGSTAAFPTGCGGTTVAYTKYLTVDGVDPIFPSYTSNPGTAGIVPICTSSTYSSASGCGQTVAGVSGGTFLANVANGSYPIWSIYRAVVPTNYASTLIGAVLNNIATAAEQTADFVPLSAMQVFRSHYAQAGVSAAQASNGHLASGAFTTTGTELGGDVGGAVYAIQADSDHIAQYGTEITGVKQ